MAMKGPLTRTSSKALRPKEHRCIPAIRISARCQSTVIDCVSLFEENSIVHLTEFEGQPSVRPLTREELVVFFDFCDARVNELRRLRRKGSLAALRDAALFKLIYAWGLRRRDAAHLDVRDFTGNPAQPAFGRCWFASESKPQIGVLITPHLRGFRHDQEGVFDDRAGTFAGWQRGSSSQAVSLAV
jgi:hypothetical protein